MPKATPNMPNRAPVPRFCTLYPTVAAAAFTNGVVVLLAADALVDVAWIAMLLAVLPVAEAVSLKLSVTLWAAQSCRAKSSVSGTSVC